MAGPGEARYDHELFIVHADADRPWVDGYLRDAVGVEPDRLITRRDFRPGASIPAEFDRAVATSRYTALVLSPAFLADHWAEFGEQLVTFTSVEEGNGRVLALTLRPCVPPPRLRFRVGLDCTEAARWEEEAARLRDLLGRPEPEPKTIDCPYPGMLPFDEKDARFFHGRQREIQQLLRHFRNQRFLLVIGSSGSGKSSLIRAGLLANLHRSALFPAGSWLVRQMRPGGRPMDALAEALGGTPDTPEPTLAALVSSSPPARRILLVVDQFEELFTQVDSRPERARFVTALDAIRRAKDGAVLIAMRAEFYPELMESDLWPVDAAQRLELTRLRGEDLRTAIERPAADQGVFLESELVQRLLLDAADEPGALPLIQETLVLLWDQRQRQLLPLAAYERMGGEGRTGLAVAVASHADGVLASLDEDGRRAARRIFLRLVQFGEGRPDTRRRQRLSDLGLDPPGDVRSTLEHLISNRLLTGDGDLGVPDRAWIDLSHEVLLTSWATLRGWIDDGRRAEVARRRLEEKAGEWSRGLRRELDEVELAAAREGIGLIDALHLEVGEPVRRLILASQEALERRGRERQEHEQAIARERDEAHRQLHRAAANRLAIQSNAVLESQPQLAVLLAVEAVRATAGRGEPRTPGAEQALRGALARVGGRRLFAPAGGLDPEPFAAGHPCTATPDRGSVILEDLTIPDPAAARIRIPVDPEWSIDRLILSRGNRRLAAFTHSGRAILWDLSSRDPGVPPRTWQAHESNITGLAISDDGRWLATSCTGRLYGELDNRVRLWDLDAPNSEASPLVLPESWVFRIQFSPDGRRLVTFRQRKSDFAIRVWDLGSTEPASGGQEMVFSGGPYYIHPDRSFAFSHDDRFRAAGSAEGRIVLWRAMDGGYARTDQYVLTGHEKEVTVLAFSPDGSWLSSGGADGTIRLWDVTLESGFALRAASKAPLVLRGHEGAVSGISFTADGRGLISTGTDRTARLWSLSPQGPLASPMVVHRLSGFVEAEALKAMWRVEQSDGEMRLQDLTVPGTEPIVLHRRDGTHSVHGGWRVEFDHRPDGRKSNTARLWRGDGPDPLVLRGHAEYVTGAAFSPDGKTLFVGSEDGSIRLYDLTADDPSSDPILLRLDTRYVAEFYLTDDGRWLLAGNSQSSYNLWLLDLRDLIGLASAVAGRNLTPEEWRQYIPEREYQPTFPDLPTPAAGPDQG